MIDCYHSFPAFSIQAKNRRQFHFSENYRLLYIALFYCNDHVISRLFQKWWNSGVVSA
jgi:hypothetical protein